MENKALLDPSLLVNIHCNNYIYVKEALLNLVPHDLFCFIFRILDHLNIAPMVSCGYNHTVILTNKGNIVVFGSNNSGQLGRSNEIEGKDRKEISQLVIEEEIFSSISSGDCHSLGLTREGNIFFCN
jgi:alpha-tubulin suppressor-like RCC1 family protein